MKQKRRKMMLNGEHEEDLLPEVGQPTANGRYIGNKQREDITLPAMISAPIADSKFTAKMGEGRKRSTGYGRAQPTVDSRSQFQQRPPSALREAFKRFKDRKDEFRHRLGNSRDELKRFYIIIKLPTIDSKLHPTVPDRPRDKNEDFEEYTLILVKINIGFRAIVFLRFLLSSWEGVLPLTIGFMLLSSSYVLDVNLQLIANLIQHLPKITFFDEELLLKIL
ncbi:hypothetical protein M9H77_13236 [Catharanthus roseus]|uniref:Uncharacterized protein n=1 Tax=Catharanthus roseus TaxID=4058 RepID=A0ACC0BJW4_CATRO|nr:hypothetical protein M9H77_13236 [Catharanthus roseus]